MSQINVNRIKDSNEGAPDFPSGVNVSGITSTVTLGVTNLNPTNVNVSGVVTATTLDGNLLATGTPTLGLGVTINASGVNISGVATAGIVSATTLYGDGSNLTGIALSIAPLNYNPAVYGVDLDKSPGIGLTFNQAVKAGSGEVTLRQVGAAGTVVQTWGVGSSITYDKSSYGDTISMSLVSNLAFDSVYHLSYPSGAFTNIGGDVSYVGTGYTFDTKTLSYTLWTWGANQQGNLGLNQGPSVPGLSSPTQIPGTWNRIFDTINTNIKGASQTTGTLYSWGKNEYGQLGVNDIIQRSSPTQIPGTTWAFASFSANCLAVKTDGTLWGWGRNEYGQVNDDKVKRSSPTQIGSGTDWKVTDTGMEGGVSNVFAVKTDGTLWVWGRNESGVLGQNNNIDRSSPVQIPGTNWSAVDAATSSRLMAVKTDGTLWACGKNEYGALGANLPHNSNYSSPAQIPGTTWTDQIGGFQDSQAAIKTDGTLWTWGKNNSGALGQNNGTSWVSLSSPVQVPGTTWSTVNGGDNGGYIATKTDGTIWTWGSNYRGVLGQNSLTYYSSPVQIPGTSWAAVYEGYGAVTALKEA